MSIPTTIIKRVGVLFIFFKPFDIIIIFLCVYPDTFGKAALGPDLNYSIVRITIKSRKQAGDIFLVVRTRDF